MRVGELRHRVTIGKYTSGTDPTTGDPVPRQWQELCTVWAHVRGLSGSLLFQSMLTTQQSTHEVVIRYREGIEPGHWVRVGNRELEIQAVLDQEGRRRWLTLICREVRPA